MKHVPHDGHLPDPHSAYMRHRNGAIEAIFAVQGISTECMPDPETVAEHGRMKSLYRSLAMRSSVTATSWLVHHEADDNDVPRLLETQSTARRINDAVRRRLIGEQRLWLNQMFAGFVVKSAATSETTKEDVEELDRACGVLKADLGQDYGLRLLGLRRRGDLLYSEPAEAMGLVLTGIRRAVPLPAGRLARAIVPFDVKFRRDGVIEIPLLGQKVYAAGLGLSVYPAPKTRANMMDVLLHAPYRHAVGQCLTTMWLDDGQRLLTRQTNQLVSSNDPAYNQKDDLADAAKDLQNREFALGTHSLTMLVFADSESQLDRALQVADRDLRSTGAIVSQLTWDLESGYFGMLGGTGSLHHRAVPITTDNFASFAPLHGSRRGHRPGAWCDHIGLFTTRTGEPFFWNPHIDSEGEPGESPHLLLTGPNRAGKTTLQQMLLVNVMSRAKATVLHWGKDRDAFYLALRHSGPFFSFRPGEQTGLNPLKALSCDDPSDMEFLRGLVRAQMTEIAHSAGKHLSEQSFGRLDLALRVVMRAPRAIRTYGELTAALDEDGEFLRPWCKGGALGWVLDSDNDLIQFGGTINVFDQTHYIDHELAAGPIQSYLMYRGRRLADGRRLIMSADEFWKGLKLKSFRDLTFDGLKTFPKKNAAMWLSMQMVADALRIEGVGETLRTQCLTQMHFPDGAASWDDYGPNGLCIPERPFWWITAGLVGGGKGQFLLKQGSKYTPLRLSLEGDALDDIRAELSARDQSLTIMDELIAKHGMADRDKLFAEFHQVRKERMKCPEPIAAF